MPRRSSELDDLRDKLRAFAKARDWDQFHSPKNLSMALSAEAAEILEHFLWTGVEESRTLSKAKRAEVEEEIADVLLYLVRLSDQLGIDPLKAAHKKLKINATKYPARKVKGKSLKYTEYSK